MKKTPINDVQYNAYSQTMKTLADDFRGKLSQELRGKDLDTAIMIMVGLSSYFVTVAYELCHDHKSEIANLEHVKKRILEEVVKMVKHCDKKSKDRIYQ